MEISLYNPQAEVKALITLCESDMHVQADLLKFLGSDGRKYFGEPATKSAFSRYLSIFRTQGQAPSFDVLRSDQRLTVAEREDIDGWTDQIGDIDFENALASIKDSLSISLDLRYANHIKESVDIILQDWGERNEAETKDNEADTAKAFKLQMLELSLKMQEHYAGSSDEHELLHIGRDGNSEAVLEEVLENAQGNFVPTGFDTFDQENAGFPVGGFVLIGGATGAGKSILATQLSMNMSMFADVCLVPLEMTATELHSRMYVNWTGIESSKLRLGKLSDGEKIKIREAYSEFENKRKVQDTRLTVFKPTTSLTMSETLNILRPMKYKVIIIDYMGLLSGVDGEDSWRVLGAAAREAKIFADQNKCIIIGLVQLDAEGKIRYSRAMEEHASLAWYFEVDAENQLMKVRQPKARMSNPAPFTLGADRSLYQVYDLEHSKRGETRPVVTGQSMSDRKGKHRGSGQQQGKPAVDYNDPYGDMPTPQVRSRKAPNLAAATEDEPQIKKRVRRQ